MFTSQIKHSELCMTEADKNFILGSGENFNQTSFSLFYLRLTSWIEHVHKRTNHSLSSTRHNTNTCLAYRCLNDGSKEA